MSDETKPTSASQPPAPGASATPASPAASATPAAAKPAAPAAAPKPPAAPPKPAPLPWESELITGLKRHYGSGIREASIYLGQKYMVVDPSIAYELLQILHNDESYDYCVDITAVHYPKREKQFDVLWILYSFARNERIRVKTQIADGESLHRRCRSGRRQTGLSAKSSTCSGSSSTDILI